MKIFCCLFLSALLISFAPVKQTEHKEKVRIWVSFTEQHCGGMEPDEAQVKSMNTPRSYLKKKIFIKRGEKNLKGSKIIFSGTTDSTGKVSMQLAPGKYILVDETKCDRKYFDKWIKDYKKETAGRGAIDRACLENWWAKPDLVFEVKAGEQNEYSVNYLLLCSWNSVPCSLYKGNYPP